MAAARACHTVSYNSARGTAASVFNFLYKNLKYLRFQTNISSCSDRKERKEQLYAMIRLFNQVVRTQLA